MPADAEPVTHIHNQSNLHNISIEILSARQYSNLLYYLITHLNPISLQNAVVDIMV